MRPPLQLRKCCWRFPLHSLGVLIDHARPPYWCTMQAVAASPPLPFRSFNPGRCSSALPVAQFLIVAIDSLWGRQAGGRVRIVSSLALLVGSAGLEPARDGKPHTSRNFHYADRIGGALVCLRWPPVMAAGFPRLSPHPLPLCPRCPLLALWQSSPSCLHPSPQFISRLRPTRALRDSQAT